MTIGEILIAIFVFAFFIGGIYVGIKLFRWNQRDMAKKKERNDAIRARQQEKED